MIKIINNLIITLCVIMVLAASAFAIEGEVERDQGTAQCNITDGYHTVTFDNGASYSGNFKGCHPLAGPAVFVHQGQTVRGKAEPIGGDQVRIRFDGGEVTITVVTHQVSY
ncbi:MAG: hypothetical protein HQL73_08400 [Magnetococcales bacterium]|nr:hypothetical protein [Magnetococcales bacterium]